MYEYESITCFFYEEHRAKCYGYPRTEEGIKTWILNNKDYAKEVYMTFRKHQLISAHSPIDQKLYRELQIWFY